MVSNNTFNYKTEAGRYNYYYRRLHIFYQKPAVQVSSAVLFTLGIIIFFGAFAIRPTLITIGELLRKIKDQQVVLDKARTKAAALATAQQLYNQVSPDISVIDSAIPPDYRIQQLLLYIESTAGNLGIPISNLSINKLHYPLIQPKSASIQEMPFTLSFTASYPDVKRLLTNLNQLPRLVSIDSISIGQPGPTRSQNNSQQTTEIEVNLNCRIFYYPEKS